MTTTAYGHDNLTSVGAQGNAADSSPHTWHLPLVLTAAVICVVSIILGNPSLALLGLTLLICVSFGYLTRPRGSVRFSAALRPGAYGSTPDTSHAVLNIEPPDAGARAIVNVSFPGARDLLIELDATHPRELEFCVKTLRTGPREQFGMRMLTLSSSGDWFGVWEEVKLPSTLVLPAGATLGKIPTSPVTRGLTGPRTARRAGDGTEFRDLGAMAWGDSQRRIDWRASARDASGLEQLMVRRTYAQAEATTIVMLDSRDDVGPEVITWGSLNEIRADHRSSLDYAREAAVAVVKAANASGDRIGFEDLARPRRAINPSTGSRHVQRIEHAVALSHPVGSVPKRSRAPMVPSGSFIYLISTFLDDSPITTALSFVRNGHHVIALDVLPELSLWDLSERQRIALRLIMMRRTARLRMLRAEGIEVLDWKDSQTPRSLGAFARLSGRKR